MYFHIHFDTFAVSDVIPCGQMGQLIRNHYSINDLDGYQRPVWRLFQEQTFELIRVLEFPSLPSRLRSIFLFESELDANQFIGRDRRDGTNIYEVKLVQPQKHVHRASMKLYDRVPLGRPTLPALEDQARQYWQGVNRIDPPFDFQPELIVESDVVVTRVVALS